MNNLSEVRGMIEQPVNSQSLLFHIVRFHKPEEEQGFLSNWYMRDFSLDGKNLLLC